MKINESFIDKNGELISRADFVILEGGMDGGTFIDIDKINISEFIVFETKLKTFNKKSISSKISRQILEIYIKTSLKKYNDIIGFKPSMYISNGGGWDMPSMNLKLSEEFEVVCLLEKSNYYFNTGYEEYMDKMRKDMGIKDIPTTSYDGDKNRFIQLNKDDIFDKLENTTIKCVPKIFLEGNLISEIDSELISKYNGDNHNLYTKNNLFNDLNEIGLFLFSQKNKTQSINLEKTNDHIYLVKTDAIYNGYYSDDENGPENYTTSYRKNYLILCSDKETWEDVLLKDHKGNPSAYKLINLYSFIYGGEDTETLKSGNKVKTSMVAYKPEVIKYKEGIILPRNMFNFIKKQKIIMMQGYTSYDKKYIDVFPELGIKLPKRIYEIKMINEVKRFQKLAGIKEIKVNNPNLQPFTRDKDGGVEFSDEGVEAFLNKNNNSNLVYDYMQDENGWEADREYGLDYLEGIKLSDEEIKEWILTVFNSFEGSDEIG